MKWFHCFWIFLLLFASDLGADMYRLGNRTAEQLLPFRIVNNTTFLASDIYVTIYGFNEPVQRITPTSPRRQGFIKFVNPSTGTGSFMNADTTISSDTYSYKLSAFPLLAGSTNTYLISLPFLDSGELFFSIKNPLKLTISLPAPPAPQYATISNPTPANPNDPCYSTIYDKMEFSYEPPNLTPPMNQVTINVTAVDFFAIPMFLTLNGGSPATTGITASRKTIMDNLKTAFNGADIDYKAYWNSLILKRSSDSTILRVLSPGNGLGYSYPPGVPPVTPAYFALNYLQDWLAYIWDGGSDKTPYYQQVSNVLTVKTVVSGTTYYGLVNTTNHNFEFRSTPGRSGPVIVTIPAPTLTGNTATKITFEAQAPWPGSTPTNQDAYDIGRLLQAGIITGYLPCTGDANTLSKENLTSAASAGNLYKKNTNLPVAIKDKGPWYDLYSAAIFPDGNGAYTWAWDDLVYTSAAPSLAVMQPTTYVEIKLGNCAGL